jgi:DNA processing protein
MMPTISANTQAILLLTAPLIIGRNETSAKLLSHVEYSRLARQLHELQKQPSDLLTVDAADLIRACQTIVPEGRLHDLLARGFLLSQAVERWQSRSIWVVSRADPGYPKCLRTRLKGDSPVLLYGCGPLELLSNGDLAIVGSRHVDDSMVECTMAVGELAARAGRTVVSGGAKGIDQAAMNGALDAGGKAVGVLADSLERAVLKREHRSYLRDGKLVLTSPYDPNAGFNVGHAMQRNKLIYALAKASLVMNSDLNKGGTWAGAVEQLDKFRFVPVYVRTKGETSSALDALVHKGALPWPNPQDVAAFDAVLHEKGEDTSTETPPPLQLPLHRGPDTQGAIQTEQLSTEAPITATDSVDNTALSCSPSETSSSAAKRADDPAELLFMAVREAVRQLLKQPLKEAEVASRLQISTAQAKVWLKRLLEEGIIAKQTKPVGYIAKQSRLFR